MKTKTLLNTLLLLACKVAFSQLPCPGTPTIVYASQTYSTVQIGSQCWLKQNLNVGVQVADVTVQSNNAVIEKACYNNSGTNCNTYGGIYTWDEAMNYTTSPQGICPNGWHIPTRTEWNTLISFLGSSTAGQKMKVTSADVPSWDGTNISGFTGKPGGIGQGTNYLYMGTRDTYWSSTSFSVATDAYDFDLSTGSNLLTEANNTKNSGYCVRCIMDFGTGLNEINQTNGIKIYPNPNNGKFSLQLESEINNAEFVLVNLLGQQVYSEKLQKGTLEINTGNLAKGFYYGVLLQDKRPIANSKMIIE